LAEPTIEELKQRIAKLKSREPEHNETEEPETESSGGLWDYKLPADWKPPARYISEEYARDHSIGFKIGDRWTDIRPGGPGGFHNKLQALPHPRYNGKPGDLITKEMEQAYDAEWNLWHTASMKLEGCIRLWRRILEFQDYWTSFPDKAGLQKMFDQDWQWLLGAWASRGMTPASTEDLERWFRGRKN
jgi:hypothetical protein